ncbi:MAG: Na(+)-translocating NADH-quinone reductase subunit C, partial [Bacteroidales bacterium]
MDKQSNTYTVIYASVMVIVVAAVLAFTSLSLK